MKSRFVKLEKPLICVLIIIGILGVLGRFYQITQNQFVYYDEGMWLGAGRDFVSLLQHNLPKDFNELINVLRINLHLSLASAKALWLFLANLRGLFFQDEAWYFTRLISAIFGSLTLIVTYFFAKRYFESKWTALLSMALLAILPSHFYYSRVGLQETFSTFWFLLGLYFYLYPRKVAWQTFCSSIFLSLVFFANYRMIIIPILILFVELFATFAQKQKLDIRKYIWHTLTFLAIIFFVGNIDQGKNSHITFSWMLHQKDLAGEEFDWFNFFSYPYYIFRLESIPFGFLFFGNIYFAIKRQWLKLLPFSLVCLQMILFSFAQEKGVRYICVVLPLMVMAVSVFLIDFWQELEKRKLLGVWLFAVIALITIQILKVNRIMHFHTDYEVSMKDIKRQSDDAKVLSTQSMVQKLFTRDVSRVKDPPLAWENFVVLESEGFNYLVIDPQAYISFTQDGLRFSPQLKGYLEFIVRKIPPVKVYRHFNPELLERFVLEHNVNLRRSLNFLNANTKGQLGMMRVYDMKQCVTIMKQISDAQLRHKNMKNFGLNNNHLL